MADREPALSARIARAVGDVDASLWDGLAGKDDPFLSHRFLALLESSGSVREGTGWSPLPVLVDDGGATIGAVPAYLKTHSQGEYVFDHGWAQAWEQAGRSYYPKLQVTVPFTPCPGRRLLSDQPATLLAALESITVQNELSSAHVTFCTAEEVAAATSRGWLERHGLQYHWLNRGYANFDAFLGALSSRKRKAIRKERAGAIEGLDILTLRGAAIEPAHWQAMWHFYQDTGARKWGRPYLTRAFFDQVGDAMGEANLMFLALRDGLPIAGALNFIGTDTLYGRYWGASEEVPFLHFELSYYRAIAFAIEHGFATVQAGAQGEHKLARGYEPIITRSAHFIPNPGFRRAVGDFVTREREAMAIELQWAREALPYKAKGQN